MLRRGGDEARMVAWRPGAGGDVAPGLLLTQGGSSDLAREVLGAWRLGAGSVRAQSFLLTRGVPVLGAPCCATWRQDCCWHREVLRSWRERSLGPGARVLVVSKHKAYC